jgi:hypothetical protein
MRGFPKHTSLPANPLYKGVPEDLGRFSIKKKNSYEIFKIWWKA